MRDTIIFKKLMISPLIGRMIKPKMPVNTSKISKIKLYLAIIDVSYLYAISPGKSESKTLEPSSGGIGTKLKIAKLTL